MPPSSKRSQRARRETINSNVDIPDSSPSRPTKRRKRVEEALKKPEPEPVLPQDRSGIDMSDDELVSAIVPYLAMPDHTVQASQDHANLLHERHSKEGVQAYAKITGKDWTFYVKRLKNNIGRPPEGASSNPISQFGGSPLPDTQSDESIHIDLGPSKMISRQHASITYVSETDRWSIEVQGRNGIKIDNEPLRRTQKHELVSGEVIEIGGVEMMFVLPAEDEGGLKVHRRYLQRAGLISVEDDESKDQGLGLPESGRASSLGLSRGQNGGSGPLPIAPAPPDYRRPGTPVSARSKAPYSARKSPAYTNGGTILLSGDDVDLSLDSSSHIKPSFSYAQMISQAILATEDEKLTLNGIYTYIMEKYAYYRHQLGGGWQNSIRHNLSLNKSFTKVARATDEPGKGMKWCIVPEARDEMVKNCNRGGRGGHRGSSAPGSPANFSMLGRAYGDGDPGSAQKRSSFSRSPPLSSYPPNAPQYTPDRAGQLSTARDQLPGDGSPLPRHRRPNNNSYGLSDNLPGSPPALSSSYLQDEGNSLVTPAPHRVQPYLAPPSTAQRPSQHMPTSSPAPFWKYADQTPMRVGGFDSSPIKGSALPPVPASSSPVPARKASPAKQEMPKVGEIEEEEEEGIDLIKGFQSIGSFHSIPPGNGLAVTGALKGRS